MTVAVLEKEREVAPHQTGHNSGVVSAQHNKYNTFQYSKRDNTLGRFTLECTTSQDRQWPILA